ncbi:MAG TPA: hypothetical protein VG406_21260 [Isosphaeraceae bacterium]|jgi:hypothetical protein|nr:hypothetical protein [Isosphaeraceae bacterium]
MTTGSKPAGIGVGALLWGVAFAALATAALMSPADAAGIEGLALGGHALWATALAIDLGTGGRPRRRAGTALTVAVLGGAGLAEAAATGAALADRAAGQALWFGLAASFAAAGVVTSLRRAPSDGVLGGQVFFHLLMLIPALANLAQLLLVAVAGPHAAGGLGTAAPLVRVVLICSAVALPLLFTSLVAALAHDLHRPPAERGWPWLVLLAHEAAFVALAARWAGDGL